MNEEITKLQARVKIAYRKMVDPSKRNECALMRVNNYRDMKLEDQVDPSPSIDTS